MNELDDCISKYSHLLAYIQVIEVILELLREKNAVDAVKRINKLRQKQYRIAYALEAKIEQVILGGVAHW